MMHLLEESGMNDVAAGTLGKYFVFGWLYGDFILSRSVQMTLRGVASQGFRNIE